MERVSVVSSNIRSIGYSAAEELLEVEFASGIYRYHSVPENVHEEFMAAASHGRYFARSIKDRYVFVRIT
ncbi:KTSC domain-containing protein [Streptomyces sp. S07_1.15]|uniref:KTSC domain-containing protein n=1 Tax=Streptomyces sp. S07_1.15 TaxID=2873925 RepID=UPI001D15BBBA|nr:KTSC domain-containing protein [Streptomyces sp. S07_1.15]MCC3653396.1 KTSC domain-containing protein [Streptomyces sp. S07_1.15]